MEQPVLLSIVKTDANYRFRLDLPEGPSAAGQEYSVDLTFESRERLRRSLQSASQSMQSLASAAHSVPGFPDGKDQTTKLGVVNDALLSLGRFLFEVILPAPLQEAIRRLSSPLI